MSTKPTFRPAVAALLTPLLLGVAGPSVKDRTAQVVIVNRTGKVLESVSVGHQYGCLFKGQISFQNLAPDAESTPFSVRYRTGILTTGRDWWVVSWLPAGSSEVIITNPKNLRGTIDALEGPIAVAAGAGIAAAAAAAGISPDVATAAGKATSLLLKPECTTKGFKQHILRAADEPGPTKIVIGDDEVQFVSPSGTSSTRDFLTVPR